jgi:hypothetical protein
MIMVTRSSHEKILERHSSQFCRARLTDAPPTMQWSRNALWILVWLSLCSSSHGQENCGAEVKILLSPEQTQAAISSFHARRETEGRVLFYDTDQLELLSRGVIVRLRQGADHDITVKLRPMEVLAPPFASRDLRCEVDRTGDEAQVTYSIQCKYTGERVLETGNEILALLSGAQRRLLGQALSSVNWHKVRRIADIRSKEWQAAVQPHFKKLKLELWEWPTGRILEISSRIRPDREKPAYEELRQLVKARGLSVMARQRPKTGIVLETLHINNLSLVRPASQAGLCSETAAIPTDVARL